MFGIYVFRKVFVFIATIVYGMYLFMLNRVIYYAPSDKISIAVLCTGNIGWIFIMLYTYIMCYPFLKKWERVITIIIAIVGTLYIVNLDLSCDVILQYIAQ